LSAVYLNQTNLNVKLSTKLGGTWPTQTPIRTATARDTPKGAQSE